MGCARPRGGGRVERLAAAARARDARRRSRAAVPGRSLGAGRPRPAPLDPGLGRARARHRAGGALPGEHPLPRARRARLLGAPARPRARGGARLPRERERRPHLQRDGPDHGARHGSRHLRARPALDGGRAGRVPRRGGVHLLAHEHPRLGSPARDRGAPLPARAAARLARGGRAAAADARAARAGRGAPVPGGHVRELRAARARRGDGAGAVVGGAPPPAERSRRGGGARGGRAGPGAGRHPVPAGALGGHPAGVRRRARRGPRADARPPRRRAHLAGRRARASRCARRAARAVAPARGSLPGRRRRLRAGARAGGAARARHGPPRALRARGARRPRLRWHARPDPFPRAAAPLARGARGHGRCGNHRRASLGASPHAGRGGPGDPCRRAPGAARARAARRQRRRRVSLARGARRTRPDARAPGLPLGDGRRAAARDWPLHGGLDAPLEPAAERLHGLHAAELPAPRDARAAAPRPDGPRRPLRAGRAQLAGGPPGGPSAGRARGVGGRRRRPRAGRDLRRRRHLPGRPPLRRARARAATRARGARPGPRWLHAPRRVACAARRLPRRAPRPPPRRRGLRPARVVRGDGEQHGLRALARPHGARARARRPAGALARRGRRGRPRGRAGAPRSRSAR